MWRNKCIFSVNRTINPDYYEFSFISGVSINCILGNVYLLTVKILLLQFLNYLQFYLTVKMSVIDRCVKSLEDVRTEPV